MTGNKPSNQERFKSNQGYKNTFALIKDKIFLNQDRYRE